MSQEPATGEEVLAALERTLRCGSARIEFRFQVSLDDAFASESGSTRPRGGSVRRRLIWLVESVVSRMFEWGMPRLVKRLSKRMAEGMVGIIDFEANRCVYYESRSKAEMIVRDRRWHGAPGTTVEGLSAGPASALQPLWMVDLVRGVVDAREQGAELLDGRTVRRFSAHADLNRAAGAVSYEMAIPLGIDRLNDLTHIAAEVWVDDDGHIRRIRHLSGKPISTSTLDLTEFGITLPSDWSRIPTVATDHPGEQQGPVRRRPPRVASVSGADPG
ncbi:MAG: hypothetical protein M3071_07805 [Actinomycetota bacterium]|nr:hypothetical protein [Actinomycetota bacterium]